MNSSWGNFSHYEEKDKQREVDLLWRLLHLLSCSQREPSPPITLFRLVILVSSTLKPYSKQVAFKQLFEQKYIVCFTLIHNCVTFIAVYKIRKLLWLICWSTYNRYEQGNTFTRKVCTLTGTFICKKFFVVIIYEKLTYSWQKVWTSHAIKLKIVYKTIVTNLIYWYKYLSFCYDSQNARQYLSGHS